jgi:hypothetical protein
MQPMLGMAALRQKRPFVAVPSVGGWFDHPLASVVGYRPRYEVGYA